MCFLHRGMRMAQWENRPPLRPRFRMHPLYDPAVLGNSPCGRLVCDTAACGGLLTVRDGWDPHEAY